jgi:hypothetical protein
MRDHISSELSSGGFPRNLTTDRQCKHQIKTTLSLTLLKLRGMPLKQIVHTYTRPLSISPLRQVTMNERLNRLPAVKAVPFLLVSLNKPLKPVRELWSSPIYFLVNGGDTKAGAAEQLVLDNPTLKAR